MAISERKFINIEQLSLSVGMMNSIVQDIIDFILSSPYRSALKFFMFLLNAFISFLSTDHKGLSLELPLQ